MTREASLFPHGQRVTQRARQDLVSLGGEMPSIIAIHARARQSGPDIQETAARTRRARPLKRRVQRPQAFVA